MRTAPVTFSLSKQVLALALAALLLAPPSAFALLNIDGTRNQVFVFGNATFAYDSNVFAQSAPEGDYVFSASVGVELKRRAGIIAVNARAIFAYQQFAEFTDQSSWNPSFNLELNKTTGRTTGALTISAFRSSRADAAVNLRTQTWNFPIGLNVKYPVNDKFYLTSNTSYLQRSYVAENAGLLDYMDIGQSIDLFYVFTSKLDLVAGYRTRIGHTDVGTTTDHSFSFGVMNGLLPKVNGSVRLAYQIRETESGETFDQFSINTGLTWNATRKLTVSNSIGRDFNTTATGITVDSITAGLRANYVFTRKFQAEGGIAYGRNRFLGISPARRDDFFSWDLGATYSFNEHLRVTASYNYMKNWSTLSFSDFERSGYSVDVSSRF